MFDEKFLTIFTDVVHCAQMSRLCIYQKFQRIKSFLSSYKLLPLKAHLDVEATFYVVFFETVIYHFHKSI